MAGTSADKLAYLQETKNGIRNAIIAKGVDVPESTPFRQYGDKIGSISAVGFDLTDCTVWVHNLHMAEAEFYYNDSSYPISSTGIEVFDHVNMTKQIKAMDSSYGSQLPLDLIYDAENSRFKITIYPV